MFLISYLFDRCHKGRLNYSIDTLEQKWAKLSIQYLIAHVISEHVIRSLPIVPSVLPSLHMNCPHLLYIASSALQYTVYTCPLVIVRF